MRLLPLLFQDPLRFFLLLPVLLATIGLALVVAISVHEFSHGLMAYNLGDNTAKRLGRLSLNPLAHLDPLGTLMLFIAGFGWGKPVPVDAFRLRLGHKSGMALVAVAGPASNLVVAGLVALPVKLGLLAWHSPLRYVPFGQWEPGWIASDIIGYLLFYNIILAIFNLIPLPPLDGFRVAAGLLPGDLSISLARFEPYGPALLLMVILLDNFTGLDILWRFLQPATNLFSTLFVGRPFL